jgi:hypothetical protein
MDNEMKKIGASIRNWMVRILMSLPDPAFYAYKYFVAHRRLCSFKHPRRFSEKIFHRMRYPSPLFSKLADKVEVRAYIANVAGAQYLVPAFLSCERVTPATFQALPNAFVMKASHSVGQLRIVHDKTHENLEQLAELANSWLRSDFPVRMREKHYRLIPPKILFEQALLTDGKPPADYKFSVFNASGGRKPFIFIQHMQGRFENLTQDLYLEDWTPAPFKLSHQKTSGTTAPRPEALEQMVQIARKLAEPLGYLRVDFYLHEGKVYVGELTVTPGAGRYVFDPPEWDAVLGEKFGWPEAAAGEHTAAVERELTAQNPHRVASTLE